jgi:hypothetical protein
MGRRRIVSTPFLRRLQDDCYYRLLGATELANIAFILQRRLLTDAEIENQLRTVKGRNGKVGICAIVGMPTFSVPSPDTPGPVGNVEQSILVLEHPELNAGSAGTGSNAEEVALEIVQQLHHYMPASVAQVLTARADAIVPDLTVENLVGYLVTLHTSGGLEKPAKVATPAISGSSATAPSTITITCATSGATIRYTTDGSNPSPGNPTAATYSAPFAQAIAAEIRAVASKASYQQSNTARLIIT